MIPRPLPSGSPDICVVLPTTMNNETRPKLLLLSQLDMLRGGTRYWHAVYGDTLRVASTYTS